MLRGDKAVIFQLAFDLPHLDLDALAPAFELRVVDLGLQLHEPVEIQFVDAVRLLHL